MKLNKMVLYIKITKKKLEIKNALNSFQTLKQDLKNYRSNLINNDYLEKKYGIPKETLSKINNDHLKELKLEIEKLKEQLEDINIVISEDNKKIEELRDAIQNLNIEGSRLNEYSEEKTIIKESQKKTFVLSIYTELIKLLLWKKYR